MNIYHFCFLLLYTGGRGKQKFLTEMQIEFQLPLCITEENREMPQTGLTFREISITIRSNFTFTDIGSDKRSGRFYRSAYKCDYWLSAALVVPSVGKHIY